jgi:hypothetical protein
MWRCDLIHRVEVRGLEAGFCEHGSETSTEEENDLTEWLQASKEELSSWHTLMFLSGKQRRSVLLLWNITHGSLWRPDSKWCYARNMRSQALLEGDLTHTYPSTFLVQVEVFRIMNAVWCFGRTPTFQPWRWTQRLPEHWHPTTSLHGVTTQKIRTWILTAVKTSNPTFPVSVFMKLWKALLDNDAEKCQVMDHISILAYR